MLLVPSRSPSWRLSPVRCRPSESRRAMALCLPSSSGMPRAGYSASASSRGRRQPVHRRPGGECGQQGHRPGQSQVHHGRGLLQASIPVSEIANAKGVLQITPTSTNPAVTLAADGKTKDYIFRACFIDPFQGLWAPSSSCTSLKPRRPSSCSTRPMTTSRAWPRPSSRPSRPAAARSLARKVTPGRYRLLGDPGEGRGCQARRYLSARLLQHREPCDQAGQEKRHHRAFHRRRRLGFLRSGQALRPAAVTTQTTTRRMTRGPRCRTSREAYGEAKDDRAISAGRAGSLAYDATNLILAAIEQAGTDDPPR